MRVTLKDIVEKTGISRSVISMYLNKDPRVRLLDEKKKRIDEAVRELGYRPSLAACTLRKGRSRMIGLVLGGITDAYFSHLAEACLMFTEARGYQLLVALTSWNKKRELHCLENLIERQVDGIFYIPELDDNPAQTERIRQSGIPVLLNGLKKNGFLGIVQNSEEICSRVVETFAGHGHRSIACCSFYSDNMLKHFTAACEKNGIKSEIFFSQDPEKPAVAHLLEKRPSAIYITDCKIAAELLLTAGKQAPDYFPEIITYYNFPMDLLDSPQIIGYVFGNFYQIARNAIDFLIAHIESANRKETPDTISARHYFYTHEEFFRIKDSLITTIDKAERNLL